jgi:hypothetical protein
MARSKRSPLLVIIGVCRCVLFIAVTWRGRQAPDQSSDRHFDETVVPGVAIHALAQTLLAVLANEPGLIELGDEVVQVMISLENDVTPFAAISAAGASFRAVGFAMERHRAFAPVPGPGVNFYLINEHAVKMVLLNKKGEVGTSPE